MKRIQHKAFFAALAASVVLLAGMFAWSGARTLLAAMPGDFANPDPGVRGADWPPYVPDEDVVFIGDGWSHTDASDEPLTTISLTVAMSETDGSSLYPWVFKHNANGKAAVSTTITVVPSETADYSVTLSYIGIGETEAYTQFLNENDELGEELTESELEEYVYNATYTNTGYVVMTATAQIDGAAGQPGTGVATTTNRWIRVLPYSKLEVTGGAHVGEAVTMQTTVAPTASLENYPEWYGTEGLEAQYSIYGWNDGEYSMLSSATDIFSGATSTDDSQVVTQTGHYTTAVALMSGEGAEQPGLWIGGEEQPSGLTTEGHEVVLTGPAAGPYVETTGPKDYTAKVDTYEDVVVTGTVEFYVQEVGGDMEKVAVEDLAAGDTSVTTTIELTNTVKGTTKTYSVTAKLVMQDEELGLDYATAHSNDVAVMVEAPIVNYSIKIEADTTTLFSTDGNNTNNVTTTVRAIATDAEGAPVENVDVTATISPTGVATVQTVGTTNASGVAEFVVGNAALGNAEEGGFTVMATAENDSSDSMMIDVLKKLPGEVMPSDEWSIEIDYTAITTNTVIDFNTMTPPLSSKGFPIKGGTMYLPTGLEVNGTPVARIKITYWPTPTLGLGDSDKSPIGALNVAAYAANGSRLSGELNKVIAFRLEFAGTSLPTGFFTQATEVTFLNRGTAVWTSEYIEKMTSHPMLGAEDLNSAKASNFVVFSISHVSQYSPFAGNSLNIYLPIIQKPAAAAAN